MSYSYHYFFRCVSTLDQLASQFNETFGSALAPRDDDPTVYQGRVFATDHTLSHNWVSDSERELNQFPFHLSAKIWAPQSDLLFVHPAVFFSTIYLLYSRLKIEKGVWLSDSYTLIAEYDYVCRDAGWKWYDLTHECVAGNEAEHVEDYLSRVFPRSAPE
jgi:hypothetical protein